MLDKCVQMEQGTRATFEWDGCIWLSRKPHCSPLGPVLCEACAYQDVLGDYVRVNGVGRRNLVARLLKIGPYGTHNLAVIVYNKNTVSHFSCLVTLR